MRPNLVRRYHVRPAAQDARTQGYHLSPEDLADDAIPDGCTNTRPSNRISRSLMYWASGAIHAPHHIMKEWADKYKGKFDDGWDAYRERVFPRAKEKGWIPANAQLTPRHETMPSWESIPEDEKPFQRRLMEVAAGFAEHVDVQVGRVIDEIDKLGVRATTLSSSTSGSDNGSSSEGQQRHSQ